MALLALTFSCTSSEELALNAPIFRDTISRGELFKELAPEIPLRRSSRLDSLIDTTKLIFIQTNDSTLLATIDDVELYDDILYILDLRLKQVVAIDSLGGSIFSIHDSGRSRREYLDLRAMELSGEQGELYLLDGNGGKILVYDLMGRHKRAIMLPRRAARRFAFLGDGKFALEFGCRGGEEVESGIKGNLMIFDSQSGEVIANRFLYKDDDVVYYPYAQKVFSKYKDHNYFWPMMSNTVYEIEDNGEIKNVLELDFGDNQMPMSMFRLNSKKYFQKFRKENYAQVERFIEFDDMYYISTMNRYNVIHHFYNKKTMNRLECSSNYKFGEIPNALQYYLFKLDERRLCGSMTAEKYLQYNKLDTLVKIDDNPVLFIYELRDTLNW